MPHPHPICFCRKTNKKITKAIDTDYGHPMRAYFQNTQIFWTIGQICLISCEVLQGILGTYYLLKFCHCVSLVCDFALLIYLFVIKIKFSSILQNFLFGFVLYIIWDIPKQSSCVHSPWVEQKLLCDERQAVGKAHLEFI